MDSRHRSALLAFLIIASMPGPACRSNKQISGKVTDFETNQPLAGATVLVSQTGWGIANGSVVWDKSHLSRVQTAAGGEFTVHYRVGTSANLKVEHPGYVSYRAWYPPNAEVRIKLKRADPDYRIPPNGFLRLGQRTDGRFYGWNFAGARIATSPDDADLLPDLVESDKRGRIRIRTSGAGRIRFVSREQLGVDDMFLLYSDWAPPEGYESAAEIRFESGGGIYFVRTRDGLHFAKFEFVPHAFAMEAASDIKRDLSLRYVYNPKGTRDLRFQEQ